MTQFRKLGTTSALAILALTTPAFADLNPQQVWGDMKSYLEGTGYDVTATEATSGDSLKITDLEMTMPIPEEEGTLVVNLGEMTFTDLGDGTVSVDIPATLPITATVRTKGEDDGEADDGNVDMVIDISQTDQSTIASGDASNITYDYEAAELAIVLKSLVVDGEPVKFETLEMVMKDIAGSQNMETGSLRNIGHMMEIGSVDYNVAFKHPEEPKAFTMKGTADSLAFEGSSSYPAEVDMQDMVAALKAGLAFGGTFSYASGSSEIHLTDDGELFDFSSKSGGGNIKVALDQSQLSYDVTSRASEMKIAGDEIPFPVELAMAEAGFKLAMPVSKSEEEQDFALAFNMSDFTMSEEIWSIFDPASQLPRDPATVALDLTGKAKFLLDLFDPKQMETLEKNATTAGEVSALDINNLKVAAAGAELTGDGAFTFDNSDLTTFDGMPAPTGEANLQFVGANALIDRLIAMGLLPEDEATGVRMMMGMFTVAGDGEDTLKSKIEITDDGQVMANGQRLK